MLLVEGRRWDWLAGLRDVRLVFCRDRALVGRRALVLLLLLVEDLRAWVDEGRLVSRHNDARLIWVLATDLPWWLL